MTRWIRPGRLCILLAACGMLTLPLAAGDEDVRAILNRAKAEALTIPRQAQALALLAWPEDGPGDPLLAAAARHDLVHFGHDALNALRQTLKRVDPVYRADVAAAFIQARYRVPSGMPPDYLPGLADAIWYGSIEAKRLAISEVSRYRYPPAVTTTIDAAHEHPELLGVVIRALGQMGDARAKGFLEKVLYKGSTEYRRLAARSLSFVGDPGLDALREASQHEDATIRAPALAALLPRAVPDDLSLLHEYVHLRADDEPQLLKQVRERAAALELELEQQQLEEAASQDPGS